MRNMTNTFKFLLEAQVEKRQTGKPRDRGEVIKMYIMEMECGLSSIGLGLGQALGFSELSNELYKNRELLAQ